MGIFKTSAMDCDRCEAMLTDSDGEVSGSEKYVIEKAELAGWEYRGGWYCAACLVVVWSR